MYERLISGQGGDMAPADAFNGPDGARCDPGEAWRIFRVDPYGFGGAAPHTHVKDAVFHFNAGGGNIPKGRGRRIASRKEQRKSHSRASDAG